MIGVHELVQAVRRGGTEGEEALLALGLLMERERVHRPVAGDDGGIRAVLGDEYADRRLSDEEVAIAVDELLAHVAELGPEVEPSVVWALSKRYDPRIVSPLADLLLELVERFDKEDLAYQALLAVINVGVGSPLHDRALEAIRAAAARGSGRVEETARRHLEIAI